MKSAFALAKKPLAEVLPDVRVGLPASMFEQVASSVGLSTTVLAEKLGIAPRTLTRKLGSGAPLSKEASEKILRVARVHNLAAEIFKTNDAISQWLLKPDAALGDAAPIDLLDTDIGAREVENLLRALAHGQFV